jgi:hypothetical protein
MTQSDLPECLRKLGGQPYNGEKVKITLTEKHWKKLEPGWLEILLEQESA